MIPPHVTQSIAHSVLLLAPLKCHMACLLQLSAQATETKPTLSNCIPFPICRLLASRSPASNSIHIFTLLFQHSASTIRPLKVLTFVSSATRRSQLQRGYLHQKKESLHLRHCKADWIYAFRKTVFGQPPDYNKVP
ncbi:unnamed protein product [Protopolystoma xenopodis]|uniref:Uncharacterized protein n=1 Tax=Protopolystoma xenopodis TaxID=117903 RepID=A0A3S5AV65_9PLAT|nr:unnamed protein product [Protopolystoma xenopodis]